MYLIIDIGNTRHKVALFDHNGEIRSLEYHNSLTEHVLKTISDTYSIKAAIISSVGKQEKTLVDFLRRRFPVFTFADHLKLPITLKYGTINTLGTDRIACAVAANQLHPNQNVLTFQAGTCLVADFVNAQGEYLGGSISPGIQLRLQSLHNGTSRLPLIEAKSIDFLIGNSTKNAILSGVINGISAEIDGLISRYSEFYPDLVTLLTGGDSNLLKYLIKNSIFAAQNLVLYGLYKILDINVSKI